MNRQWAAPIRLVSVLCSLLAVACAGDPASAKDRSAESVFGDAREYTVRVRGQIERAFVEDQQVSYTGAGFLVDAERGWIVTNAHVAGMSPSALQVAFAGGRYQPARKIYVDTFSDIAVIAIDSGTRGRRVARLQCDRSTAVGEAVGVFGHPLGLAFTGTRGIVSGHTKQFGPDFIQTDAAIDGGNSGGPVMRLSDGGIIGIATAKIDDDESPGSNFVTASREVCRILELLRAGVSPDPMRMKFSLLVDDDGGYTMEVAESHDADRWPLRHGDRILGIEGDPDTLESLTELVTALRGREGPVGLRVARDGRTIVVATKPERREGVLARRGINIDGALIAPVDYEDGVAWSRPARLIVHSVEEGTPAASVEIAERNTVESVDGRRFDDLDALFEYLRSRESGTPLRIVFRRGSPAESRLYDFHVRELPGDEIEQFGAWDKKVAAN